MCLRMVGPRAVGTTLELFPAFIGSVVQASLLQKAPCSCDHFPLAAVYAPCKKAGGPGEGLAGAPPQSASAPGCLIPKMLYHYGLLDTKIPY